MTDDRLETEGAESINLHTDVEILTSLDAGDNRMVRRAMNELAAGHESPAYSFEPIGPRPYL